MIELFHLFSLRLNDLCKIAVGIFERSHVYIAKIEDSCIALMLKELDTLFLHLSYGFLYIFNFKTDDYPLLLDFAQRCILLVNSELRRAIKFKVCPIAVWGLKIRLDSQSFRIPLS